MFSVQCIILFVGHWWQSPGPMPSLHPKSCVLDQRGLRCDESPLLQALVYLVYLILAAIVSARTNMAPLVAVLNQEERDGVNASTNYYNALLSIAATADSLLRKSVQIPVLPATILLT